MNKEEAIHKFWSSFGLKAYEENSVPTGDDAPEFPYLTYTVSTGSYEQVMTESVNIYYRSASWQEINNKEDEIAKKIGLGGIWLDCDAGSIWVMQGQPFAQSMSDANDELIRRKYININMEFITRY